MSNACKLLFKISISLNIFFAFCSCNDPGKQDDYLLLFTDTLSDECGYKNLSGDRIIKGGKYEACFTDTFRDYAIVLKDQIDFVAISRDESVLYHVFTIDNGPDYFSEGTFRITRNNKIGYADSATGKIIIEPVFACAFPFENGIAKVSMNCTKEHADEHITWLSEEWSYIDKSGNEIEVAEDQE